MTQPDVHPGLAEEMALRGRPVAPERLDRASRTLRALAQRRDPDARAAAREQLRTASPAA